MTIVSVHELSLRNSDELLFNSLNLHIKPGEKICLLGRNGSGKSTLLKLIAGLVSPDDGSISISRESRLSYLPQEINDIFEGSVRDFGLSWAENNPSSIHSREDFPLELEKQLSRLGLDPDMPYPVLSGGGKRRCMISTVLASDADILLLDEPTNHLDMDNISWLENYLQQSRKTVIMVTHDRMMVRNVATGIGELDRGELQLHRVNYEDFLIRRREQLEAELQKWEQEDSLRKREEAWLRQGIKARRTRDEGRVKALFQMRATYAQRRTHRGKVNMQISEGDRSGDLVAELADISFGYSSETRILNNFSFTLMRGDKIGIAGPNGSGKTTLARLISGELEAGSGTIRLGSALQPLYLDQLRSGINPSMTVREVLAGKHDSVIFDGRSRHINAYLQDFLFDPERAKSPVHSLSGGEKNRLLLAKLFLQPANLLILDEPTNDLDIETLEMLEDLLVNFKGTVLLISHDRTFLDNVVSACLIFNGDGTLEEFPGGYSEWFRHKSQLRTPSKDDKTPAKRLPAVQEAGNSPGKSGKKGLSYKEQQLLASLPDRIGKLEEHISGLHQKLADPEIYRTAAAESAEILRQLQQDLESAERELEDSYRSWEELESRAGSSS